MALMKRVELQGQDATVILSTDQRGWCQVSVETGNLRTALGADTAAIVWERLVVGLDEGRGGQTVGHISGHAVTWVATFAERHCSVYASDDGDVRYLFVQGADGTLLITLTISREEREQWRRTLLASKGALPV